MEAVGYIDVKAEIRAIKEDLSKMSKDKLGSIIEAKGDVSDYQKMHISIVEKTVTQYDNLIARIMDKNYKKTEKLRLVIEDQERKLNPRKKGQGMSM